MLVAATHLGQVSKFQWSVPGAVAPAMSCLGPGRPAGSVCGSRPATHHAQGKKLIDHHKSSHVIDRAFWPNRLQAATGQNARSTSEVRPGTKCSQPLR